MKSLCACTMGVDFAGLEENRSKHILGKDKTKENKKKWRKNYVLRSLSTPRNSIPVCYLAYHWLDIC